MHGSAEHTTGSRALPDASTRPGPPIPPRRPQLGDGSRAALLGVFAAALALAGSWNVSLWTDEAATIAGARRALPELWLMLQNVDAVHGLYYLLMHFWIDLFGQSALSLRMPSALAIGAGTAGVYVLARRLDGRQLALWSALIFALLPRATWAGMEARSFSFSAAAAVWLTVVLMVALQRATAWWWAAYAALAATAIAFNLYLVLLLAAHAVTLLVLREINWRLRISWVMAAGLGTLASAPVVLLSLRQGGQISDQGLGLARWARNVVINQWFLGDTPTTEPDGAGTGQLWVISAVALAALCWLLMAFALWRALKSRRGGVLPRWFLWVVPQVLLPTLIIGCYSLLVHPMYNPRYLTFSTPAVAILIGVGLWLLPRYWQRAAALVLIVLFTVPIYLSQRQVQAKSGADWVETADFIGAYARPGDGVYFSPRYPSPDAVTRLTLRRIAVAYPEPFAGLRDLTADIPGAVDGTLDGSSNSLSQSLDRLDGLEKVWVIRRADYPADFAQADDRLLQDAGFQSKVVWTGSLNTIMEFTR